MYSPLPKRALVPAAQEAARRNVMESLQTQYQVFLSAKDKERSLVSAIEGAQIVVDSYGRQFIAIAHLRLYHGCWR